MRSSSARARGAQVRGQHTHNAPDGVARLGLRRARGCAGKSARRAFLHFAKSRAHRPNLLRRRRRLQRPSLLLLASGLGRIPTPSTRRHKPPALLCAGNAGHARRRQLLAAHLPQTPRFNQSFSGWPWTRARSRPANGRGAEGSKWRGARAGCLVVIFVCAHPPHLLLDRVGVGRPLGRVEDFVGQALCNGLDRAERRLARAHANEVQRLVHAPERRHIHGLRARGEKRGRPGGGEEPAQKGANAAASRRELGARELTCRRTMPPAPTRVESSRGPALTMACTKTCQWRVAAGAQRWEAGGRPRGGRGALARRSRTCSGFSSVSKCTISNACCTMRTATGRGSGSGAAGGGGRGAARRPRRACRRRTHRPAASCRCCGPCASAHCTAARQSGTAPCESASPGTARLRGRERGSGRWRRAAADADADAGRASAGCAAPRRARTSVRQVDRVLCLNGHVVLQRCGRRRGAGAQARRARGSAGAGQGREGGSGAQRAPHGGGGSTKPLTELTNVAEGQTLVRPPPKELHLARVGSHGERVGAAQVFVRQKRHPDDFLDFFRAT